MIFPLTGPGYRHFDELRRPATEIIFSIGIFLLLANQANADCVLPYTIESNTVTDANKLTFNNKATSDCIDDISPRSATDSVQIRMPDGAPQTGGIMHDGQLLIGLSTGEPASAVLQPRRSIKIDSQAGSVTISRQSATGLYARVLSPTPSLAATALTNWVNQGASTAFDNAVGLTLDVPTSSADNLVGRYRAAPTPPYTVTALVAATRNSSQSSGTGLGWYDGSSKFHVLSFVTSSTNGSPILTVEKWSSVSSLSGSDKSSSSNGFSQPIWLRLSDSGSTVSFSFSQDGVNFTQFFSSSKSSGFLGSSGYSNVVFTTNPRASRVFSTMMSWRID